MVQLATKAYQIWANQRVHTDLYTDGVEVAKKVTINLPAGTVINSVRLAWSITNEIGWPTFGTFKVNGEVVASADQGSGSVDVTSGLFVGDNIVSYLLSKPSFVGWGDHIISASLIIDYTGDEPIVPPPSDVLPEWLLPVAIVAVVGIGAVILLSR